MGVGGFDHLMTDFSPAGWQAQLDAGRAVLAELDGLEPVDDVDRVTLAAMRERIGLELELHDADEWIGLLNNIASPVQELRDVFDVMPTSTPQHWENIAARLNALPTAAAAGAAVRTALEEGAAAARAAYAEIAAFLRDELAPQAPQDDAAGRERYALWSQYFLGATVDLEETYTWGLAELARVVAEQEAVAEQIAGEGATVEQAIAVLDAEPGRVLDGKDALQAWMQTTADAAIEALDGVHFDIPEPVRRLECRIAPTHNGGIYYTAPSDDFSRPGRRWWSVPPALSTFTTRRA